MIAKRFENLSIMEKELVYIGKTKDVYALENGKKQVYDWERYYSVIRKYHPDAVISVCGPDVRWIGNEGGKIRKSEWSVIPIESNNSVAENSQTDESQTKTMAEKLTDMSEDLGSRDILKKYEDLVFKPAEADVSVNIGWFWHDNRYYRFKKKRTAKQLAKNILIPLAVTHLFLMCHQIKMALLITEK